MLQNGKFPFPRAPLILRCSSRSCQMPGHLEESRPLLRGKPDFRSPVRFCRKVEGFSQGSNGSTFASETNFSHVTIHPESANCSQERATRTFFCAENTFSSTERTFWHAKYVLACPERTLRSAESVFFLTELREDMRSEKPEKPLKGLIYSENESPRRAEDIGERIGRLPQFGQRLENELSLAHGHGLRLAGALNRSC